MTTAAQALTRTPVRTRAELLAVLPVFVASRVHRGNLFGDRYAEAALRVLAAAPSAGAWCYAVKQGRIDVDELLMWSDGADDAATRVLVSVAVSLYGSRHPQPSFHSIIQSLDAEQLAAVADGFRIAQEGLAR